MAVTNNNRPDTVKGPGEKQNITKQQAAEYLRCVEDPIYFMKKYVKITHIDHGLIPFKMYPYQEQMVKNFHSKRFNIALLSRQSGKCVSLNTVIRIRNKNTGEVQEMTVEELYELQSRINPDLFNDLSSV